MVFLQATVPYIASPGFSHALLSHFPTVAVTPVAGLPISIKYMYKHTSHLSECTAGSGLLWHTKKKNIISQTCAIPQLQKYPFLLHTDLSFLGFLPILHQKKQGHLP